MGLQDQHSTDEQAIT